jgi:predicted ATPase
MDRLIVKNFGPLKNVNIEIKKINLFIGKNGTGKSVLGKLLNILKNLSNEKNIQKKDFEEHLESFGINFIQSKTLINYDIDDKFFIQFENSQFNTNVNLNQSNIKDFEILKDIIDTMKKMESLNNVKDEIIQPLKESFNKALKNIGLEKIKNLDDSELENFKTIIQETISQEKSHYIPAERNLISIFSSSMFSFLSSSLATPKYLIDFGSQFELSRNKIKTLNLLNVKYVHDNNLDKVYFSKENSLPLDKSSSAIQSVLPLLLVVNYLKMNMKEHTKTHIVIEELELNLFPQAQTEVLKSIVDDIPNQSSIFLMTHSPYVLTALNNLILANDIKNQKGVEAIKGIVKETQCIAFEDVSAYSLVDGKSIDIMDKEDRLIGINLIDSISDEVNDVFDTLLMKLD